MTDDYDEVSNYFTNFLHRRFAVIDLNKMFLYSNTANYGRLLTLLFWVGFN